MIADQRLDFVIPDKTHQSPSLCFRPWTGSSRRGKVIPAATAIPISLPVAREVAIQIYTVVIDPSIFVMGAGLSIRIEIWEDIKCNVIGNNVGVLIQVLD